MIILLGFITVDSYATMPAVPFMLVIFLINSNSVPSSQLIYIMMRKLSLFLRGKKTCSSKVLGCQYLLLNAKTPSFS